MSDISSLMIIAITSSDIVHEEDIIISSILEEKRAHYVHIRKPYWDCGQTRKLIRRIPEKFHPQLKLHDHFSLLKEFNIGGVHLNNRNPVPLGDARNISKSVHSLAELKDIQNFEYVTLSPIYESISKPGYKSDFNLIEVKQAINRKRVVALGGITPDKFPELIDLGFFGAAMLSYFWPQKK